MKRWRIWILLAVIVCLPILLAHATSPDLLRDSDTATLLRVVRQRQAPMTWFTGDWPLQNHFYRPLPTLAFELDSALYGSNAAGYGWTNAILCFLCAMSLFWFLRELTDSPAFSIAGTALFSAWTLDNAGMLEQPCYWIAGVALIAGFLRHGFAVRKYLAAPFVWIFLGTQVSGIQPLEFRMVAWLPGRTASVMTLFALIAMAAYARYERTGSNLLPPRPTTALDRPASTRTTESSKKGKDWIWAIVAVVATAAAFASYEQAVMLPACLLGVAVYFRLIRKKPRWTCHAAFWLMLFGYIALRHTILPPGVSGYQAQQYRPLGGGVYTSLADYVLPNVSGVTSIWIGLSVGFFGLLGPMQLNAILTIGSTVIAFLQAKRFWILALTGWALSGVAYLPMAWLKQFEHYHYWPMALRTIFVVAIARVAWQLLSIAVCPPEMQAPPRPSPAPGSLPRQ